MKDLDDACEILKNGGVIVHATEAVYGLGAGLYDYAAFCSMCDLKKRPAGKKFIILFADIVTACETIDLDTPMKDEILSSWPGPSTWVLPAKDTVPCWAKDNNGSLAVRVTAHEQCIDIIGKVGPLISTSANRAGAVPPKSLKDVQECFGCLIDFYLPGGLGGRIKPTTIRDGLTGDFLRK